MIQVFIFHGFDVTHGQRACLKASEKVNRFLQKHTIRNPRIQTSYASPYSSELGHCYSECVVTLTGEVEQPITLAAEDLEDLLDAEPVQDDSDYQHYYGDSEAF